MSPVMKSCSLSCCQFGTFCLVGLNLPFDSLNLPSVWQMASWDRQMVSWDRRASKKIFNNAYLCFAVLQKLFCQQRRRNIFFATKFFQDIFCNFFILKYWRSFSFKVFAPSLVSSLYRFIRNPHIVMNL